MATGAEVLTMLRPDGGWVIYGDDFDGILWRECEPLTKAEFEAGFDLADKAKAQAEAQTQAKREVALSKLAALGLTGDDLKALGL